MDRMYRHQRHIYDASRKFYLLGRDGMIADLRPPAGGSVLEIGCGTGRNLVRIARTYPDARCFGLDVSSEMLDTAGRATARAGLAHRIRLSRGDATAFDPARLFGEAEFDRIVISYALSMIPPWRAVLAEAAGHLAPGGSLHVVDFGDQGGLPMPARWLLNRWLAGFHVTPRQGLADTLGEVAQTSLRRARIVQRFGGYAVHGVIEPDRSPI
ncbi:Demethylrebeccamycin-D-glucose O-methyltransferase [Methylobacterium bullatum]|uniref:Demethylrebeccamycin-D-glucose O-methyltransferase n=2 Tax=Methylobacterium bullatum TaxID=570505 RepID=A0A679K067_9HYPH|nr:Demethylrebeccamycin-D-glucose O-methyltransferase [Methylobacterium bullatum]